MSKNNASILALIGSTGSGKSLYLKGQLSKKKPPRLLIWDPMREYSEFGRVFSGQLGPLVSELAQSGVKGRFAYVYQPDKSNQARFDRQFSLVCGLALAAGHLTLIVEELALVTKAGYSPPRWMEAVTGGRHRGLSLIGTTQRPALVDKTFFGNATVLRVGRLNAKSDKRVMADVLDLPDDDLTALLPLHFIQKNMLTGAVTRDRVSVP